MKSTCFGKAGIALLECMSNGYRVTGTQDNKLVLERDGDIQLVGGIGAINEYSHYGIVSCDEDKICHVTEEGLEFLEMINDGWRFNLMGGDSVAQITRDGEMLNGGAPLPLVDAKSRAKGNSLENQQHNSRLGLKGVLAIIKTL